MRIAVADIAVINRQRTEMDKKELNELVESLKISGQLQAIVVRKPFESELAEVEGKPYVLMVGGRRLAAHMILGWEHIRAELFEEMSPLDAEVAELEENLRRSALTWQDELAARARMHALREVQNPFQTVTQTAAELNLNVSQVSRDLQLMALIKQDPTLLQATTKASAVRQAKFKENTAKKLAAVETAQVDDLKEKLVTADWLEYAKTFADKSVPLVLCDLPYAIDQFEVQAGGENHISKFDDHKDTVLPDIERLVPELVRIVKPDGWICLFMSYEFHGWLMEKFRAQGLSPELPPWIWNRGGSAGSWGHFPELHAGNRFEMIVVVNGGSAKLLKKPVENVLSYQALHSSEKFHNHQKPHDLLLELISRFTVPGELVVDFCFGSGSTLAAAAASGRDFRGCEKNPALLDGAIANVAQYTRRSEFSASASAVDVEYEDLDDAEDAE